MAVPRFHSCHSCQDSGVRDDGPRANRGIADKEMRARHATYVTSATAALSPPATGWWCCASSPFIYLLALNASLLGRNSPNA